MGRRKVLTVQEASEILGLPIDRLKDLSEEGILNPIRMPTGETGFNEDEVLNVLVSVMKGWMSYLN